MQDSNNGAAEVQIGNPTMACNCTSIAYKFRANRSVTYIQTVVYGLDSYQTRAFSDALSSGNSIYYLQQLNPILSNQGTN